MATLLLDYGGIYMCRLVSLLYKCLKLGAFRYINKALKLYCSDLKMFGGGKMLYLRSKFGGDSPLKGNGKVRSFLLQH